MPEVPVCLLVLVGAARWGGRFESVSVLGWLAALVVLICLLVWAVVRIRSLFRDDDDPAAIDRSMLMQIGDLHRQGDLSEEEYRSIKRALAERLDGAASRHNDEHHRTDRTSVSAGAGNQRDKRCDAAG